jgi:hypothetical protein
VQGLEFKPQYYQKTKQNKRTSKTAATVTSQNACCSFPEHAWMLAQSSKASTHGFLGRE